MSPKLDFQLLWCKIWCVKSHGSFETAVTGTGSEWANMQTPLLASQAQSQMALKVQSHSNREKNEVPQVATEARKVAQGSCQVNIGSVGSRCLTVLSCKRQAANSELVRSKI